MARIMIVDDEVSVRHLVSHFLKSEGHQVVEAESGDQALALAGDGSTEVILLDIDMPGIDGIETLRRLRSLVPHTTVIMLSGISDERRAVRALEEGALDYISKPFELKRLRDILVHQLALRS